MADTAAAHSMIVIMGVTGAGKSYFINKLAGKQVVKEDSSVDPGTQQCELIKTSIGSNKVILVDTPGFDDPNKKDSEILDHIAMILSAQYEQGIKLKGVIYVHRITDIKFSRSAKKTFELFQRICGDGALDNLLLVTSRWDDPGVNETMGSARESELRDKFAWVLRQGGRMSRFYGDQESARALAAPLLAKSSVVLQIQKELIDEAKPLNQTTAGAYVHEELEQKKSDVQKELQELERLKRNVAENDRLRKRQMQRDVDAEKARLKQLQAEQERLNHSIGSEVQEVLGKKKGSGLKAWLMPVAAVIGLLTALVGAPLDIEQLMAGFGS